MNRSYSLKKNKQFQYVYRRGTSRAALHLVLLYVRAPQLKVGFSVSKKVGGSVMRNRIKRLLRENFRNYIDSVKPGLYILAARKTAAEADYHSLGKSLNYLLRKQGLFKESSETL